MQSFQLRIVISKTANYYPFALPPIVESSLFAMTVFESNGGEGELLIPNPQFNGISTQNPLTDPCNFPIAVPMLCWLSFNALILVYLAIGYKKTDAIAGINIGSVDITPATNESPW